MTEEQIKQNAEAYASELVERDYHEDMWLDLYDAHIAGAHNMLEEIKELELSLEAAADVVKILTKQLNELRNPWISVEKRLHERENDKASWSNYVFIRTCFNSHEEAKYDTINHI